MSSLPVQGSRYLRSTVTLSSPVMASTRSATIEVSVLPLIRASEIVASRLPRKGIKPKFEPMLASVGEMQLYGPMTASRMRAIVPLPLRFGPISMNAFCWEVSAIKQ